MFEADVDLYGKTVRLKWDEGELTGDEYALREFHEYMQFAPRVGPAGGPMWEPREVLGHATPVYLVMKRVFPSVEIVGGELPPLPKIPKGAIP